MQEVEQCKEQLPRRPEPALSEAGEEGILISNHAYIPPLPNPLPEGEGALVEVSEKNQLIEF